VISPLFSCERDFVFPSLFRTCIPSYCIYPSGSLPVFPFAKDSMHPFLLLIPGTELPGSKVSS